MNISKQKLKNRLIKFEPISHHRYSVKKLQNLQKKEIVKEQSMFKNRSISQVKLPSLEKRVPKEKIQKSQTKEQLQKSIEVRDKIKSLKQVPKIKVESKAPIHDTITYLIKSQILSIPKIVGLLQKTHSDEFLYMRVVGMYEYEVCDQQRKGSSYITVSKNGMVQNGELIPLQTLVRQFQIFKKIKKIQFFQHFSVIKCMNRWLKGSKTTRYLSHRKKLTKLLNLDDERLLTWKKQIVDEITIDKKGGWLTGDWVQSISTHVIKTKARLQKKLAIICFKMMENFDLPISQSTELMGKILGNLSALSMTFEKKIRIQRQIEKFYRFGRQIQLIFIHICGYFILQHVKNMYEKILQMKQIYEEEILGPLQRLDIFDEKFVNNREKVLVNSPACFEVDMTVYIDPVDKILSLRPSPKDIYRNLQGYIKDFMRILQRMNFQLIRTQDFDFVTKNVFKIEMEEIYNKHDLRNFTYVIPEYLPVIKTFELLIQEIQQNILMRRLKLLNPFLNTYYQYFQAEVKKFPSVYEQIFSEQMRINSAKEFCQKIHEGQYFIFGYLSLREFKNDILKVIGIYEKKFHNTLPGIVEETKAELNETLKKHLSVLLKSVNDPLSFIIASEEVELLEQKMSEYSFAHDEMQKIKEYGNIELKIKIESAQEEKKLLAQIRLRMRNFKETRENNFLKYRKQLDQKRITITKQVQQFSSKNDAYFELNQQPLEIYTEVKRIKMGLTTLEQELNTLNELQGFFAMRLTTIASLEMLIVEYDTLQSIWEIYATFWTNLNSLKSKAVKKIEQKNYRKDYESFLRKLQKYLKVSELEEISKYLYQNVNIFLSCLQLIEQINSPHMRTKDLEQINYLIQREKNFEIGTIKCQQVTFGKLHESKIYLLKSQISEISFKARKQIQILQSLVEFQMWWKSLRLEGQPLQDYPLITIFGENQQTRREIQDYSVVLLNILNHKYGSFVRKQCTKFLKNMNNLTQILQLLILHQEKFLNLFPILTSKYAETQLSSQYKKFQTILTKTMKNVKVLTKPTQNLGETSRNLLTNHIKSFDSISKVLAHFLQKKRIKFQRFYFLQDDELLEVLVGIAGERNIFRMFDGIRGWLQNEEGVKIGVKGVGGEELVLRGWMYKQSQPEVIFKNLEDSIKGNLNSIVRNILYSYQIELKQLQDLYHSVPWMCIYTIEMILFTKQIEFNCFQNQIKLESQKNLIRETIQHSSTKKKENSNYITLMLFLLHFTEELRHENVTSVFDFRWNSFLRFYYDKDSVKMRSLGGEHLWGGQYQGLWQLMVNTSDIRRAHACVLGNLKHGNGVLLQGPSGTGKTQSLKELGRVMGKYCVIFNCSQDVNIRTLEKLLSGLCYTASWICLDEINRLTLQIMSVAANQITTIKNAIVMEKDKFNFMGKQIVLNLGVGIFSTMNPVYLKRAKLTENLKAYFRIITVTMPDYEKILQVMLYSLGFSSPDALANKIGKLFQAMSVQLNPHPQYDFGLRAMKFLLYNLKKYDISQYSQNQNLVKGFKEVFEGRLHPEDVDMFHKILKDAFQVQQKEDLQKDIVNSMRNSPQTGLIIFGPTSSKSTLIKKYCQSYDKPIIKNFNPSSVDMKYFMGETIFGRWQYGIVEKSARESIENFEKKTILILDSVLRSQTIQNFNTLLDESKLLTLSNGSRLKVHENYNIIMETPHLSFTSPATITRCNLIYVSESNINRQEMINEQLPQNLKGKEHSKRIQKYFEQYSITEIREIGKISKLLLTEKLLNYDGQWHENELLGLEKALIFSIRLLGLEERIKDLMHKDNSFSIKKSVYSFILSYKRYIEGEFIEITRNFESLNHFGTQYIITPEVKFCQWINNKAIVKRESAVLWNGGNLEGKSISIQLNLRNLKHIRIPLTKRISSQSMINCLQSKILTKNQSIEEKSAKAIVYVDNLHLGGEEATQMLRYMLENKAYFDTRNKQITEIPQIIYIAEKNKKAEGNQRLYRHFVKINYPTLQSYQIKNLFIEIMKINILATKALSSFKTSVEIQIERVGNYLEDFFQKKNLMLIQAKQTPRGVFSFQKMFERIAFFTQKNAKQVSDFVSFIFHELRSGEKNQPINATQHLIQLYFQTFKGKYQSQYEKCLKKQAIFTSFLTGDRERVTDYQKLKEKVSGILEDRKEYLSNFIIEQSLNIMTVLEDKIGHYCMVGEAGAGKKTILRIACTLQNLHYHEYEDLSEKDLPKYFFQIMKKGFEQKKPQCIIVNGNHPRSIELLNLAEKVVSGFPVTEIFSSEETDYAFSSISDYIDFPYEKGAKTYDEICQDYLKLAAPYVKILVSVNSIAFKSLDIRSFPSFFKNLKIQYLPEFPTESIMEISDIIMEKKLKMSQKSSMNLSKMPQVLLKIYHCLTKLKNDNKKDGLHHFKYNHLMYFKLVHEFCEQYGNSHERIKISEDVMNRSIFKINETNKILEELNQKIIEMEPEIKIKKERILEVVPILEEKKKVTKQVKYVVQSEQKDLDYRKEQIDLIRKEVQESLQKSEALLTQAYESIATIKRSQLSEIKNNQNPNPLVKFTMENLAILLGEAQTWESIKKVISDTNLMIRIKNSKPSYQSYIKVKKRMEENPEWSYDTVAKNAYYARYLCKWIIRVVKSNDMKTEMEKQKKIIEELQKEYDLLEQRSKIKKFQLHEKERAVEEIDKEYQQNKVELNRLESHMDENTTRYQNALKIRSSLEESMVGWGKKLEYYKEIKTGLESYTTELSLYLQIYPILTVEEQNTVNQSIKEIIGIYGLPTLRNLNLIEDVQDFYLDKQKIKTLSLEDTKNSKIIQFLYHFHNKPLLLDPDNQALKWIQKQNRSNLQIVKDTFSNATKNVEKAMKNGLILVILIDEQLNSFTEEILRCTNIEKGGNKNFIEYNKSSLYLHQDFHLILVSGVKFPNLETKLYLDYQVINFQITKLSLKEIMVRELLKVENYSMYSQKLAVEIKQKQTELDLKMIEEKIIQSLINNKKNLVDDQQFLSLLDESKIKSEYINVNRAQQSNQIQMVNKYLKTFDSLCDEAASIFITLKTMSKISPLINWNVEIFTKYFTEAIMASISSPLIEEDQGSQEGQEYIANEKFLTNFEFNNYNSVNLRSRPTSALSAISLATSRVHTQQDANEEKHIEDLEEVKANFSQMIAGRQMVVNENMRGKLDNERYRKVIACLLNYMKSAFDSNQRKTFGMLLALSKEKKEHIKLLLSLKRNKKRDLKKMIEQNQVTENIKMYFTQIDGNYDIYAQKVLNDRDIFTKYHQRLSINDILILSKIVQPEKFNSLVVEAIKHKGYESLLDYSPTDVSDWLQNSDSTHPILLVMGEDPINALTEYFGRKRYRNVIMIAMGEGQNKIAEAVLQRQYNKESVVILHNLHIAESFLPFLTKTLQQFSYKKVHKNFRLILITNMFESFPSQITSTCHKYIIQQPPGIRNRMKYLINRSQTIINYSLPSERKIAFSLCLLHSIINEMLNYKPLGWNLQYDFNTADFINALTVLKELTGGSNNLKKYECNLDFDDLEEMIKEEEIDFAGLKYLIGEINYIGKMADELDRGKMKILIERHLEPLILEKNFRFPYLKLPNSGSTSQIMNVIEDIPTTDPTMYGFHENTKPVDESPSYLLQKANELFSFSINLAEDKKVQYPEKIQPISHKLNFINHEIDKYNEGMKRRSHSIFLKEITSAAKVFNLRAFSNPKQFFIEIKMEVALKYNVSLEKVKLNWSLLPKENGYGISNLRLEGAAVNNGNLVGEEMEEGVTLYVFGTVKKKVKQVNKKEVMLPLYFNEVRSGDISSFGQNTNLLAKVILETKESQDYWLMRGTAFIVV